MELLSLNEPESMFHSTIGLAIHLFLRSPGIPTDNLVVDINVLPHFLTYILIILMTLMCVSSLLN